MTKDDIIRMAREAGIDEPESDWLYWTAMERFAALVAAAEREACAKVCDDLADKDKLSNYYRVAANAIRNRSNA